MSSTIVLITGANSGVGFAAAKVLACASGTFHVIMASRSLEKGQAAMSELKNASPKGALSIVQLDVTDEASIEAAAGHVYQQFGRLDVLVNNAGVGSMSDNIKTRMKLCLETNVMGPAMVAAAFRSLLLKSQNPYSIYVSSGAGTLVRNAFERPVKHEGVKNGEAYGVSKAALNMLAVLEAGEWGREGLKVFVMSPGFVRSNLRGSSEEARSGWGKAGDPEVSGQLVLDIVQGKRDSDVGRFVHKDGVYPW